MKKTCRKYFLGFFSMFGMRFRTARWKSSFIMTPMALASPGFRETGKFPKLNVDGKYGRPLPPFADLIEAGKVCALNFPVSRNPGRGSSKRTICRKDKI